MLRALAPALLLARHALVALAVLAVLAAALGLHPHQDCGGHDQPAPPCCAADHPAGDDGHDGDDRDPPCDHCHCPPAASLMAPSTAQLPQAAWLVERRRPADQPLPASATYRPEPPPARG